MCTICVREIKKKERNVSLYEEMAVENQKLRCNPRFGPLRDSLFWGSPECIAGVPSWMYDKGESISRRSVFQCKNAAGVLAARDERT